MEERVLCTGDRRAHHASQDPCRLLEILALKGSMYILPGLPQLLKLNFACNGLSVRELFHYPSSWGFFVSLKLFQQIPFSILGKKNGPLEEGLGN